MSAYHYIRKDKIVSNVHHEIFLRYKDQDRENLIPMRNNTLYGEIEVQLKRGPLYRKTVLL